MAKTYQIKLPSIRLGEFDLGGVLYHARYFHLYETIRESFLECQNLAYSAMVHRGEHLAITESSQKFVRPVRYGQSVYAKMWFEKLKKTNFVCCYEIHLNETLESLIHQAQTKHAFICLDQEKEFKVQAIPDKLYQTLESYNHP